MNMHSFSMLCLLLLTSCGFAARVLVKNAGPIERKAVVVEFGGSGCKVVVYSGKEYLEPDPTKGEQDGVLRVPGFSKKKPIVEDSETAAANIQKLITEGELDDYPIVFFVSGGHIAKYPHTDPLCDPNSPSYVAENCIPDMVTDTREKLQASMKKSIAIETDEAKLEAMSVMAGFGHVEGALAASQYPVLILLGGSTSSQLVFIPSPGAAPLSRTFIMQNSFKVPYKTLVEQKLMEILGGSSPKSVFFCSNFAFAIVRPELISDAEFSYMYFRNDPDAKARVTEKYKPNQAAGLAFSNVESSVHRFLPYRRDAKVWATLQILVDIMAQNSVGEDATFHVFKELTKSGHIVKVGASHGAAMQLMR